MKACVVNFDGHVWILDTEGYYFQYVTNLGTVRNPRPKSLTRYVWEKYNGRPAPGYKVMPIDGDRLNFSLENLRLELGDEAYVRRDAMKRNNMEKRDAAIARLVAEGADPDDAWDTVRGGTYQNTRDRDLV